MAKGIFCLEIGEWYDSLRAKHTVEPILGLLEHSPLRVPYIHRDIATQGDLKFYLKKWIQAKHSNYPILYLAFHGRPGEIFLADDNGRSKPFSIQDLFSSLQGCCHKRIIHFGACSVLDLHGLTMNKYVRDLNALAISGYATDVDWVTSSVFDLLFLSELQKNQMTKAGVSAVQKRIKQISSALNHKLKFRVFIKQ